MAKDAKGKPEELPTTKTLFVPVWKSGTAWQAGNPLETKEEAHKFVNDRTTLTENQYVVSVEVDA